MGKLKSLLKAELVSLRVTKKPDPGIWIFSSTDNAHYNYNSRYLFEYVKDNLPKITPYFVINDEKLRKKLGDKYGEQYFIETCSVEGMKRLCQQAYGLPLQDFLFTAQVLGKTGQL